MEDNLRPSDSPKLAQTGETEPGAGIVQREPRLAGERGPGGAPEAGPGRGTGVGAAPAPHRPVPYYTPPPGSTQTGTTAVPHSVARWKMLGVAAIAAVAIGAGAWYAVTPRTEFAVGTTRAIPSVEKTLAVAAKDLAAEATAAVRELLRGNPSPEALASGLQQAGAKGQALRPAEAELLSRVFQESSEMKKDLESGKRVLYRVHLLDFLQQDNDEVALFVDNVCLGPVALSNRGTEMLIPLASEKTSRMRVVATRDGGGGVTFGLVSSIGEAKTRVMQTGEVEEWWVRFK